MLQGDVERARALRRTMSPAEIGLWLALKERPGGLKFRKQHPSGPYTADFYCHAARLVIEVDGQAHDYGDRPTRDSARDLWFADRGLATMRVTAESVLRDPDAVIRGIVDTAKTRLEDEG